MKTLAVDISEELYARAERRANELGITLEQEVVNLVQRLGSEPDDATLMAARARMREMFQTVKGFRVEPRIAREELYERGRLH